MYVSKILIKYQNIDQISFGQKTNMKEHKENIDQKAKNYIKMDDFFKIQVRDLTKKLKNSYI